MPDEQVDHRQPDWPWPPPSGPDANASDTATRRGRTLPARLTSFVGRDRHLAEIWRLLAGSSRQVTLTGFGGVGKTRLAIEIASAALARTARSGPSFPDGVFFVELAALADPELVPRAVVAALDLEERKGRTLPEVLTGHLRDRRVLLVLDNCEHLVAACAALADRLLRACPGVQILATAREPLGIDGETVWHVPPLDVPTDDVPPTEAARADAVRLFVERARQRHPDFALDATSLSAVVAVCRQLEGIPLAIELAVAWLPVLTVDELAARLGDRFRLLTVGSRTAPPRHQTLRSLVDWSYDRLPGDEQALLRRLSVFAGGWTLEAAERVASSESRVASDCPSHSQLATQHSPLELLARLVAKSLVLTVAREGASRYRFLETVRQYAAERLSADERREAERRHAVYFVGLAERAGPELAGPEQRAWLARLDRDYENMRIALRWAIDHGQAELALRLCGGLRSYWWIRGNLNEGARWLERALAIGSDASDRARARALNGAGPLARSLGHYDRATAYHAEALELARRSGDRLEAATAMHYLAGVAADRGDFAEAEAVYRCSLALSRELGDDWAIARSLNNLGLALRGQGELDRAAALCEESLAIRRARGDVWGVAMSIDELARIARDRKDVRRTQELTAQSLPLVHGLGVKRHIAAGLDLMAWAAVARGQFLRAARLYGAADALRDAIGSPPLPSEQGLIDDDLARIRAALGPAGFEQAWASGRATDPDDAVAYALSPSVRSAVGTTATLTRREREVVSLIARGLSNRQIAGELVLSELTVESHVRNVLRKLALDRRGQVAAWAVQEGLTGGTADVRET